MQKQQNFMEVRRTAEYYTLLPDDGKPNKVLFVIHGYMQLPKYFIDHFSKLTDLGIAVVAPSGLSLSYQTGFDGRIGASWMTKHNRENEIKEYLAYLDKLYVEIRSKFPTCKSAEVLGFSQGSATASRWFSSTMHQLDSLVLSAGYVPEDANFAALSEKLKGKHIQFFAGLKDKYLTSEKVEKHKNFLNQQGIKYQMEYFEGGHEIPADSLQAYFRK